MARGNQLGNKQKAAVLMIALGPEASGKICQYMPEEDVEQLMIEVARLGTVSHNDRCAIIAEFRPPPLVGEPDRRPGSTGSSRWAWSIRRCRRHGLASTSRRGG